MCLKYHDIELLVAKYSQNKEPEFHFSSPQIKTEKIAKEARHVYDSFFASTEYAFSGELYRAPFLGISQNARENLIYLVSFLLLDMDKYYFTNRRNLQCYELRYTLEGSGLLEYNGKTYILEKGDGYWIDNRKPHFYKTNGPHWRNTVLHFDGNISANLYQEYEKNHGILFHTEYFPNFDMYQYEILRTAQKSTTYREYKVSSLFMLMLTELLASEASAGQERKFHIEDTLQKAMTYIQKHYAEDFSIQELSNSLFISREHLSREMKKYTGFSPKEYLEFTRVAEAKKLLKFSSQSIKEIVVNTGFRNESVFYHNFKKREGITPLQYRNSSFL